MKTEAYVSLITYVQMLRFNSDLKSEMVSKHVAFLKRLSLHYLNDKYFLYQNYHKSCFIEIDCFYYIQFPFFVLYYDALLSSK